MKQQRVVQEGGGASCSRSYPEIHFGSPGPHSIHPAWTASSDHRPAEQSPRKMALSQHQPLVPGMLDQPATRLHQTLLQTGQRPVLDLLRQHQPPPRVPGAEGRAVGCEPRVPVGEFFEWRFPPGPVSRDGQRLRHGPPGGRVSGRAHTKSCANPGRAPVQFCFEGDVSEANSLLIISARKPPPFRTKGTGAAAAGAQSPRADCHQRLSSNSRAVGQLCSSHRRGFDRWPRAGA